MNRKLMLLTAAFLAATLSGCATEQPRLGDSVRAMAEGQTYDATAPHQDPGAFDGQKAARAIEAYRAPRQSAVKTSTPAIMIPAP